MFMQQNAFVVINGYWQKGCCIWYQWKKLLKSA